MGVVSIAHAVAHLVATAHLWGLITEDNEFKPRFVEINSGAFGLVLGVGWVLAFIGFLAFGVLLLIGNTPSWIFWAAVVFSTLMCITAWPAASIGLGFNVALVLGWLALGDRL